jgi:hypothetical protein
MTNMLRPGWGYWLIAVLSLLWNSFGCFDYFMTKTRNATYLGQFPADMVAYLDAMPAWLSAFWALGVWASLAGSLLLLLRSRWAVTAFGLSLLGLAVSQIYQFATGMPESMSTPAMWGMTAFIWAALLFFLWYARRVLARGWLK